MNKTDALTAKAAVLAEAFAQTSHHSSNPRSHAQAAQAYLSKNYPNFAEIENAAMSEVTTILLKAANAWKNRNGHLGEEIMAASARRLDHIRRHPKTTSVSATSIGSSDAGGNGHAVVLAEQEIAGEKRRRTPNSVSLAYEQECPTCGWKAKVRFRAQSSSEPMETKYGPRGVTVRCAKPEKDRAIDVADMLMLKHEDGHMENLKRTQNALAAEKPYPL